MYEDFWQLKQKPFERNSGDEFYYPSEVHQGASLKLRYVIENRCAAALLAGPAGLGKSLVLQRLLAQLPDDFSPRIRIAYPLMPHDQLLAYIASEIVPGDAGDSTPTIHQSVRTIESTLADNVSEGRHALLMVDEAHLLKDSNIFQSLQLLLNFGERRQSAMTLVLVGQPSILPMLDRMPGLEEQLGVKCLMRPFSEEETVSYVVHRINAAGCEHSIFDTDALEVIHQLTGGIPRRINRLCDLALLIAFAEEQPTIGTSHIQAVSQELVAVQPE